VNGRGKKLSEGGTSKKNKKGGHGKKNGNFREISGRQPVLAPFNDYNGVDNEKTL